MKRIFLTTAALCIGAIAAPADAQSSDFERAMSNPSMEARIGLTITFGGDGKSSRSKPQLALMARRSQPRHASIDWAMKSGFQDTDFIETRLALTLSEQPELRLNDQAIYQFETESAEVSDEVKTAGKVALGAGLITLAAAVVVVGVYAIAYDGDGT